jgi:hypothetical protein
LRSYDTRQVVYRPASMRPETLKAGYDWDNIAKGAASHPSVKHRAKHFFYSAGWKKFEPLWDLVIKARRLDLMTPLLEGVLSPVTGSHPSRRPRQSRLSALGPEDRFGA